MMRVLGRLTLGVILMAGAASATPALAQDETILFSISKASEPFFEVMRRHAEDEASKLGVRLIFEDGKGDSTDQAADIENTLARERIAAAQLVPCRSPDAD
jgi:ABC-type sugar transport system substrate-binding protein